MLTGYSARLRKPNGVKVNVPTFSLSESYNTGWSGKVILSTDRRDNTDFSPVDYLNVLFGSGFMAGSAVTLDLLLLDALEDEPAVRKWPSVISAIKPFRSQSGGIDCEISIVDPISSIALRPVWGVYRSTSAAEIVGGMLSVAAGGDGKPTTNPVLPDVPAVEVVPRYRQALSVLPYTLAVGRPFSEWLIAFVGMLGLRAELSSAVDTNSVVLTLTDTAPTATPWNMGVMDSSAGRAVQHVQDSIGDLDIRGQSAFPGATLRGGVLDDPIAGGARPFIAPGAIGTVISAPEVDIDEATKRIERSLYGVYAEMLLLHCASSQALLAPASVVNLTPAPHDIPKWQVASATHMFADTVYDNAVTLLRGDVGWAPPMPAKQPPVLVSAVVDEGADYADHQSVPRDRLGRIHVRFSFTPTPVGDDAELLAAADQNYDRQLTLDDFTAENGVTFAADEEDWEDAAIAYGNGSYDDLYPEKTDDELTEEELAERENLAKQREDVLVYLAYKEAVKHDMADHDRDGVISDRDELVSDDMREVLLDRESRVQLKRAWRAARKAGTENEVTDDLVREYGRLFGDKNLLDPTIEADAEMLAAREDAKFEALPRWPPLIPVTVVEPMAGALHGFITGHRQGDVCRIAVHDPFTAEIIGFQYRDDRRINQDLRGALSGLVVEHNFADAWSGMVFRRTADLKNDTSTDDSAESGGVSDSIE